MPRTKVTKTPGHEVKWVNHGGPFYFKDGRMVKHGATFAASVQDIPKAFRDVIRPLDAVAIAEPVIQPVTPGFQLQQRGATSFFDILDGSGKRLNEKDLTEQEAKEILDKFI